MLKEYPPSSDADYRRRCLELIDEFGIGDAVRTVGELEREELLELHAAADVYLSVPSRDGTAVSVLEAMAAGVAIVAIRRARHRPGDPSLRRNGAAGASGGLGGARVRGRQLSGATTELRARLGRRAAEIVRLHGDFDRELDRAVELYEELVTAGVEAR